MINLEMSMHDAVVLRHTLFMHTKDHPGFFSDERILKLKNYPNSWIKKLKENLTFNKGE